MSVNQCDHEIVPRVSIGMPVYNGDQFIKLAIESLLSQTFSDFELIISDNASTDSTEKICREYMKSDSRIRYVRHEKNKEAISNFDYVLRKARGEYFMWAAVDDVWDKKCIEKWASVLTQNRDVALVFSNYGTYYHNSGEVILQEYLSPSLSDNKNIRLIQRMLNPCPSIIYGMYRLKMSKGLKLRNFDWFDVYFTNLMSLKGKIVILTDYLYYAGIKETDGVRKLRVAKGNQLKIKDYFTNMIVLIVSKCSMLYFLPLIILLLKQTFIYRKLISGESK